MIAFRAAAALALIWLACVSASAAMAKAGMPGDLRFRIGTPDGYLRELGLAREGYRAFAKAYSNPVVYTVGKSKTADWPHIHPSHRDRWAGAKAWTFEIRYTSPVDENRPLHLVLGVCGAHPSERSRVMVSVNGEDLPPQTAPSGEARLCLQRQARGEPASMIFDLPAGSIAKGENTIAVRLERQSWILYDYVALRAERAPLPIAEPEEIDLLGRFREGPMAGVEEIVFAVREPGKDGHWYANFAYYAEEGMRPVYGSGGRLCRMSLRTRRIKLLVDDPEGAVRDPVVHYDAEKILFSYRPGGEEHYHLYEINVDGTGLRQLTDGEYDDIEPCYLPDGDIVFVSSRCKRWVNCWLTQVAVLHRCDADGGNIRAISANNEHDNTPWVLHDGRILYQRWEYVDRSQVHYHHLWTANPDGTQQMVYFGNQHPGIVMIDARPIPRSKKVVAIFSPGHGRREHDGALVVVDPTAGPDAMSHARTVHGDHIFRDPWAFSEDAFLAAQGSRLLLIDGQGQTQTLFRLPKADKGLQCHEPRPLLKRRRERVIPDRTRPDRAVGRMVLTNVYEGRNMRGVEPGEIKKLLVLETLPKPVNFTGGMDPLTYGGSFTLERVLGTVPVEPDGSAYFEVPALRGLFLVALDENDLSVKRMQSFFTVQPGEVMGCVGCHEQRTRSILPDAALAAMRRKPTPIEPIEDCPDVFDFPRDIQPILDRHCAGCHGPEKTEKGGPYAGRVLLTGDRGPMFSHAYFTMTVRQLFSDGRDLPKSNYAPRAIGSSNSPILAMLDGAHHGVKATEREQRMMRLWIDAGGPYPGTYAALGTGSIGGYARNRLVNTDFDWPTTKAGAEVIDRRCASCHRGTDVLPKSLCDERGISFWRFDVNDPRLKLSRHIAFNLSRPEKSLLLLAPLAKAAGGRALCRDAEGRPHAVLESTGDPDYGKLLAMVAAGKENLDEIKRFDMPGFRPRPEYIREMKRYGVLPADTPPDGAIDVYATDRAYWRSLWHKPEGAE